MATNADTPGKARRKGTDPTFRVVFKNLPVNGKVGTGDVFVLDHNNKVRHTDRINPMNDAERRRFARVAARKLGCDDKKVAAKIDAAWNKAFEQQLRVQKAQTVPTGPPPIYAVDGSRICRWREGHLEPLCNFAANIVEEITRDDGSGEVQLRLVVAGRLDSGEPLPRAEVSACAFGGMIWALEAWGHRAVVNAGHGAKDHLRAAIQTLSPSAARRTIYLHTGWKQIDGEWAYLHAGGAISAAHQKGRKCRVAAGDIELPGALQHARLPMPPQGERRLVVVRASLSLLGLGPDRITVPCLAAVYRAVLGTCNVVIHLAGRTGVFKTELATLLEQHFGPGFDSEHLPANYSSTGNANEGLAFTAKDMLLVIDDFAPGGTQADVARQHREADRLIRNVGNHASRNRMTAGLSLRPPKPPRCLVVSTGEDVPRGHSLQARQVIAEIAKGDIAAENLTRCQLDAAEGLYAESMAAFIQWLAPRYDRVQADLRQQVKLRRDELRDGPEGSNQHQRTPTNLAHLLLGFQLFVQFAVEVGAIQESERQALEGRAKAALRQLTDEQTRHLTEADPVGIFMRHVRSCLSSGRAHICGSDGAEPEDPKLWGWTQRVIGTGEHARTEWESHGKCIGWLARQDLYLDPESVHAEVQRLAQDKGESMPLTTRTLGKRLSEAGVLASTDPARQTLTVRRMLQGGQRKVWHLQVGRLFPQEKPDKPDIDASGSGTKR
jgi:hypothetical protein